MNFNGELHLMSSWRDAKTLFMVTIRMALASFPIRSKRNRMGFTGTVMAWVRVNSITDVAVTAMSM